MIQRKEISGRMGYSSINVMNLFVFFSSFLENNMIS